MNTTQQTISSQQLQLIIAAGLNSVGEGLDLKFAPEFIDVKLEPNVDGTFQMTTTYIVSKAYNKVAEECLDWIADDGESLVNFRALIDGGIENAVGLWWTVLVVSNALAADRGSEHYTRDELVRLCKMFMRTNPDGFYGYMKVVQRGGKRIPHSIKLATATPEMLIDAISAFTREQFKELGKVGKVFRKFPSIPRVEELTPYNLFIEEFC